MIKLSKSVLDKEEVDAVSRVILEDGYLGMGIEVNNFEKEIADYLGVPRDNVVCVNSGTAALHLSVEAIINSGDEVLVPSFTYISSFQAISAAGGIPVCCDIYEDSLTIDLNDAKRKITKRTKAIMPVHYASNPFELDKLYEFASKNKLRVIEDAAHAFGCSYKSKQIGNFGDITCFSFDGIKNITSGEGGAIVTSDETVLSLVKDARLLGVEKDTENRFLGKRSWEFDVTRQGYRYHMSNIFAAIGRVQLKKLSNYFGPTRQILTERYVCNLSSLEGIKLQLIDSNANIISHIFPIRILNGKRDKLRDYFESNGVQTGIHYKPNHLLSLYKDDSSYPVTEKVYEEIITLPLHPQMKIDEVDEICSLLKKYISEINI